MDICSKSYFPTISIILPRHSDTFFIEVFQFSKELPNYQRNGIGVSFSGTVYLGDFFLDYYLLTIQH